MSKVFFDVGLSLDGFIAGENRGPKNTIGDGGMTIHNWMFKQKAFWQHLGVPGGVENGADGKLINDVFAKAGAYIMGKRMFEEGEPNWPENLFKADVYVLTHEKRKPWVQKGTTTFYFTDDRIENVLAKAKESAKGKDVRIQGGAEAIRQYLNAGLIDDFTIHIAPVLLGSGIRLFDSIDKNKYTVDIAETIHSPMVTHLRYKLTKK